MNGNIYRHTHTEFVGYVCADIRMYVGIWNDKICHVFDDINKLCHVMSKL